LRTKTVTPKATAKWLIAKKLPKLEQLNDQISAAKSAASDSIEAYACGPSLQQQNQHIPELLRYFKGDVADNDFDWLIKKDLPGRTKVFIRSLAKYKEDIRVWEDSFHTKEMANQADVNAVIQKRRTRDVSRPPGSAFRV
jgi:hypothetical protein